MKRAVSGTLLTLLLAGILTLVLNVQLVKANGTIYIRADGSIDPPTANITTSDYVTYTFIGNITDLIIVERSNIIIDGNGYMLQGSGSGNGFYWSGINNVTIRNTNIKNFQHGIYLLESSNSSISGNTITANYQYGIQLIYSSNNNSISGNNIANNLLGIYLFISSNNIISGNNIANNDYGIGLYDSSNNNSISGNKITANHYFGIHLGYSSNSSISGNNITNNMYGITIESPFYNSISGNNITANSEYGIYLTDSSNNNIYHNNFINNTNQVYSYNSVNFWDSGYPSGGNYWSDYEERYPNATEINDSGIWNTPYVINANNKDNYPIIPEFPSGVILPLFMMVTLIAVLLLRRKRRILCSRPKEVYLNLKQHTTYAN